MSEQFNALPNPRDEEAAIRHAAQLENFRETLQDLPYEVHLDSQFMDVEQPYIPSPSAIRESRVHDAKNDPGKNELLEAVLNNGGSTAGFPEAVEAHTEIDIALRQRVEAKLLAAMTARAAWADPDNPPKTSQDAVLAYRLTKATSPHEVARIMATDRVALALGRDEYEELDLMLPPSDDSDR